MLRGRMRSIEGQAPASTLTSSAGQRNQSNSSRPNDSKRGSEAMPKQTRSLNSPSGWKSARRAQRSSSASRFRQQRGVVALRLIGIGARQIDELRPSHVEQARTGEILARRDHLVGGLSVGQVFGLVDQNDPAGHEGPFRMTMAAIP